MHKLKQEAWNAFLTRTFHFTSSINVRPSISRQFISDTKYCIFPNLSELDARTHTMSFQVGATKMNDTGTILYEVNRSYMSIVKSLHLKRKK